MNRLFYKISESDVERLDYLIIEDSEYCCIETQLKSLFDKYEVPEEYRVLFFYKSLVNNNIKEFLTNKSLQYSNKSIRGIVYRSKEDQNQEQNIFYRINNNNTCDIEFIKKFFFRMDENNYMDRYLKALNEFFFLKISSYSINQISDSEDTLNTKRRLLNKTIKKIKS